ncbi:hypothetical protein CROQUDRAFT_90568, partial [Cronartium quercuum f. sp. fusiforme G11]
MSVKAQPPSKTFQGTATIRLKPKYSTNNLLSYNPGRPSGNTAAQGKTHIGPVGPTSLATSQVTTTYTAGAVGPFGNADRPSSKGNQGGPCTDGNPPVDNGH